MKTGIPVLDYTLEAAADLSAKQYFGVKLNSSAEAALCTVAGEPVIGVLLNAPNAQGKGAAVRLEGLAPVKLGGTVSDGDDLAINASGKFVLAVGGDHVVGKAMTDGVTDDVILCHLRHSGEKGITVLSFPVDLVEVTAADVVTDFPLPWAGKIIGFDFVVNKPVTTADDAASFNLEIETTDVTGGVIALTSANSTPLGKVISSTAITALNTFAKGDTLSIEASSVTAFAEGTGSFQVKLQHA